MILLCLQYLLHPGVGLAGMYPRIIVTDEVEGDNEDDENPITVSASYTISDISESRAESEASSSVTMECLGEIGNYDGFAQVRGSADRNSTRGLILGAKKGLLSADSIYNLIDSEGVPEYITLNQFNFWSKNRSGELPLQTPDGVAYTAAKRGGVVADSRLYIGSLSLPLPWTTKGKSLKLSGSGKIEKDKQDPNGDGAITDDEITGMFDPYAAAAGQSLGGANVDPAEVSISMADDAENNGVQNSQNIITPEQQSTPSPDNPGGSPMYSLVSSDGSYTAEAGTGHEANFTTNSAYSSVYWYVKSPSDTSYYGTNVEIDYGDSSTTTTAQLSYSFPSGISGNYQIMTYVYGGDNSVYEVSYTVSVTSSSSSSTETTSPEDTSTTPSTPTTTSPGAPTNFSVAHGYAQGIIGLYWSVPDSDGGAAINDYEYQYRYVTGFNGVSYTWSDWSSWSLAGTSGFYLVYGLTSRVIYEVKMRAVNSNGGGTETGAYSISVN